MKRNTQLTLKVLSATLLAVAMSACAPVTRTASGQMCNAQAAKGMAMKDHCLTCHSLTKQKSGPTFKAVAKRYQGNPNAEADLYAHLMSRDVSMMSDENTGVHKCIAGENPEKIRNMVRWILDQ
jgi:cytochrome c